MAAREKRLEKDLEGRGDPSADGWMSQTPVPNMPLSSPTAPALLSFWSQVLKVSGQRSSGLFPFPTIALP